MIEKLSATALGLLVILEVIVFFVFVGCGGFVGFVAYIVINTAGYYTNCFVQLKAAELLLKAEAQEKDKLNR